MDGWIHQRRSEGSDSPVPNDIFVDGIRKKGLLKPLRKMTTFYSGSGILFSLALTCSTLNLLKRLELYSSVSFRLFVCLSVKVRKEALLFHFWVSSLFSHLFPLSFSPRKLQSTESTFFGRIFWLSGEKRQKNIFQKKNSFNFTFLHFGQEARDKRNCRLRPRARKPHSFPIIFTFLRDRSRVKKTSLFS